MYVPHGSTAFAKTQMAQCACARRVALRTLNLGREACNMFKTNADMRHNGEKVT